MLDLILEEVPEVHGEIVVMLKSFLRLEHLIKLVISHFIEESIKMHLLKTLNYVSGFLFLVLVLLQLRDKVLTKVWAFNSLDKAFRHDIIHICEPEFELVHSVLVDWLTVS